MKLLQWELYVRMEVIQDLRRGVRQLVIAQKSLEFLRNVTRIQQHCLVTNYQSIKQDLSMTSHEQGIY